MKVYLDDTKTRREVISIEKQPRGMLEIKLLDRFGHISTDRLRASRHLLYEIDDS